jgi:hypothetical protein
MRRRDFIVILRGMTVTPPKGNASANARKLALCERTASEKWHPTYLRTLTDVRDGDPTRTLEVVVEVEARLFRDHPEVVDADLADYFVSVWSGPLPSLK